MKTTTVLFLIMGIQFALTHAVAQRYELYWYYPWLDILMHTVGGVLALLFLFTLADLRIIRPISRISSSVIMLYVAVLMITWEVFGFVLEGGLKINFFGDTALDIVFGILGSVIGYFIGKTLHALET